MQGGPECPPFFLSWNQPGSNNWVYRGHLTASIDKFKVPEKEKGELLAFVASMKKDIVEK
jgi:hypothetical protein